MVQATLNGFLPSDFDAALMPLIDLANPRPRLAPRDFGSSRDRGCGRSMKSRSDGGGAVRKRRLRHPPARRREYAIGTTDMEAIYLGEIETIIRDRLYPGIRVEVQQSPNVLRRGRDMRNHYAGGVHSDGPLTPGGLRR